MTSHKAHSLSENNRTGDVIVKENVDFEGLFVSKAVQKGLAISGFVRPSPIQLKAIPLGRCGLDIIVQAKSGTGKTCVFTVIALESLDVDSIATQVLVMAPTREIAVQIWEVTRAIGSGMAKLSCHTFIGGLPIKEDLQKLKKCHIAIGTPGRIRQLIETGALSTDSIRLFILDEADKLMEDDFQEQINWIYSTLPENKQMMALSATYPEVLAEHLTVYMRNPTFIRLNTSDPTLLGIKQFYKVVPYHPLPQKTFENKVKFLIELLSSVPFHQCLVFSNYQTRAESLSKKLNAKGWPSTFISGSQDQQLRLKAMEKLKAFQCRVLISTDLTSRGIDADRVNLVVNLDLPRDHETYLHRIGRAGRFGTYGAAVSLISDGDEEDRLLEIEKQCNTKIKVVPVPIPVDLTKSMGHISLDDLVTTESLVTAPQSKSNQRSNFKKKRNSSKKNENHTEKTKRDGHFEKMNASETKLDNLLLEDNCELAGVFPVASPTHGGQQPESSHPVDNDTTTESLKEITEVSVEPILETQCTLLMTAQKRPNLRAPVIKQSEKNIASRYLGYSEASTLYKKFLKDGKFEHGQTVVEDNSSERDVPLETLASEVVTYLNSLSAEITTFIQGSELDENYVPPFVLSKKVAVSKYGEDHLVKQPVCNTNVSNNGARFKVVPVKQYDRKNPSGDCHAKFKPIRMTSVSQHIDNIEDLKDKDVNENVGDMFNGIGNDISNNTSSTCENSNDSTDSGELSDNENSCNYSRTHSSFSWSEPECQKVIRKGHKGRSAAKNYSYRCDLHDNRSEESSCSSVSGETSEYSNDHPCEYINEEEPSTSHLDSNKEYHIEDTPYYRDCHGTYQNEKTRAHHYGTPHQARHNSRHYSYKTPRHAGHYDTNYDQETPHYVGYSETKYPDANSFYYDAYENEEIPYFYDSYYNEDTPYYGDHHGTYYNDQQYRMHDKYQRKKNIYYKDSDNCVPQWDHTTDREKQLDIINTNNWFLYWSMMSSQYAMSWVWGNQPVYCASCQEKVDLPGQSQQIGDVYRAQKHFIEEMNRMFYNSK